MLPPPKPHGVVSFVNLSELDLNLLKVFQAIYVERSISKAATRLGVSQPAVSKSLKRLRDFTGDTLFYASGGGVAPTRTAMALAVPIHHALETVEHSFASLRGFDPATSTRTFRVGVNDLINPLLVPALVGIVTQEAPHARLEFVQQSADGPKEAIVRGELDTGFMPGFLVDDPIRSDKVWSEQFILIVAKSHPIARSNQLTLEAIEGLRFTTQTHARNMTAYVDGLFRQAGVKRITSTYVSDIQSVYSLVGVSDLAAIVGRNTLEFYNRDDGLKTFDLPIHLPEIEAHIAWAPTSENDDGHRWLRNHIVAILRGAASMFKSA
jgi:DNA-binding transcriptional LysR family regulator